MIDILEEFGKHKNWELSFYRNWFGEDDLPEEWQVHKVNGSVNDREWTLIGSGETVFEAMTNAVKNEVSSPTQAQRNDYAQLVEGDSDNPLRVSKANEIYQGLHDDEVRQYIKDTTYP